MKTGRTASCPFCKGGITADLVQFGGNCPHCLLEIPGEEAPTDPGAVARQKAAADAVIQAQQNRKKRIGFGLVAALFLTAAGGVVVWQAQQERAARTYEMPDDLYLPPLQEAQVPTEPTPVAEAITPVNTPAKRPIRPVTSLGGPPSLGANTIPDIISAEVAPSTIVSGPRRSSGSSTVDAPLAMASGGSTSVSMDAAPITGIAGAKPLSDESEVFAMIKQVMSRYNPQIQSCYNSRLKQVPDLAGGWKLSFAVEKDGSTRSVRVDPVANHDTQLEACMVKTVSAWKFGQITYEQPVTKTVRFGSSGY